MSAIELKNLTKKYGSLTAVNDLNLEIENGEIFGFLGPNGAGKTTTIKLMTGLLKPSSGTVKILDYDIQVNPIEAKSNIGLIPDEPNIYEKLTGREFLRFMGSIFKVEIDVIIKKTAELLKIFDLQSKADELIQTYSHGMKQKIAIAGALIHSPKIIVFDEPTIGLDPKSARTIKDILKFRAEAGDCIFMSTHILEIAERMCDRIGIINNGNLIAVGNMDELRHMSKKSGKYDLEEIFLELTNAEENSELIKSLS
ncbi:ABC transporter ATP-binding protein [bacterium]|nr:ABC transporter ATP-binding protein [bacterium]